MYGRVVVFNCVLIAAFSAFLHANIRPPELSIGNAREILCGAWVNRDCCVPSVGGLALAKRGSIERARAFSPRIRSAGRHIRLSPFGSDPSSSHGRAV